MDLTRWIPTEPHHVFGLVMTVVMLAGLGWIFAALTLGPYMRPNYRWYRWWAGGHYEHRLHGDVGQYSVWTREWLRCRKGERDPWQRGTASCEDWPIMQHPWLGILSIGRIWAYTSYVVRHKWHVLRAAFQTGASWHVVWLCFLHDASKFRPSEFASYSRHFYLPDGGKRTKLGKDGFYQDEPDDMAFDRAWAAHIRRNKHHPQHWCTVISAPCTHWNDILLQDDGRAKCLECGGQYQRANIRDVPHTYPGVLYQVEAMPTVYLEEMLCDWIGAGLAQGTPDVQGWYLARGHGHPFHLSTRSTVEQHLFHRRVTDDNGVLLAGALETDQCLG